MRRILIGGTHSGCGKTTVTCAVLSALKKRGLNVAAFKCGPDYIDPMFHRKAIGVASHNLDSFFCDNNTLLSLLDEYGSGADIAVIEGVMGFYDGSLGSAHSISEMTDTPAVIVIDCKGMSDSIGAIMSGFLNYKGNRIIGFIFNRLPEKMVPLVQELCRELGTKYCGCLPKNDITIESRHLGLVTADEICNIQSKLEKLGELAEKFIEIDTLLETESTPIPPYTSPIIPRFEKTPSIAVARDNAFCFIYQENIDLLEKMGCRIDYFSPLADKAVPDCDGLILCGGYPELYAERLSANTSMLSDIKRRISAGLPTIAECGGFMYLHDEFTDKNGTSYPMAGVIDGRVFPTERLQRFGYITLEPCTDNMLFKTGETIKAHEFHYWESSNTGADLTATKTNGKTWECCHAGEDLYAGFPHLYFPANIEMAERFVKKCMEFRKQNGQDKKNIAP